MADDTQLGAPVGVGDKISTDDLGAGTKVQRVKVQHGADGSATDVSTASPMPVNLTNGMVADGGALPAQGVQVGGTDGSVFQVMSTDNAGRPNVNINGTVTVDSELATKDLDTGAGTDTQAVVGLVIAKSGGAASVSATDPLPVVVGSTTPVQIQGGANQIGKLAANSGVDIGDVDVTSSALPTGASTAAKQPALGTAGAASADVITIQGIASGTVVPVSGTVTASGPLTDTQLRASAVPVDTELPAAAALADAAANPTAPATGAFGMLWNGATWDRAPGGATNGLTANLKALNGTTVATNSGNKDAGTQRVVIATDQVQLTNAWKVDGSAVTQPVSGTVTASNATGSVAHDGADSGNPVKVGARARTSDVTAVAADDRTDAIADILGKQVTLPYALPGAFASGTANSTGTGDTSVIAAVGAGIRLYITQLVITNAHATVGTKVQIKSATTTTGYPKVFAAANGGGATITFPVPLRLAANEALNFACVTTGADVDVSASGYSAAA